MKNTLTVIGGVVAVFLAAYLLLNGGRVDEVNFLGIKIKGPQEAVAPLVERPGDPAQETELEKLRIERLKLEKELAALKAQDAQLNQLAEEAAPSDGQGPQAVGEEYSEWQDILDDRSANMEELLRQIQIYNQQAGAYDPSLTIDAPAYVNFCCDMYGNRRCQLVAPVQAGSACFCLFQGTGTAC
ncbi:MAG: hypothetical protein R2834_11560 [Rhodothermales bacterium]